MNLTQQNENFVRRMFRFVFGEEGCFERWASDSRNHYDALWRDLLEKILYAGCFRVEESGMVSYGLFQCAQNTAWVKSDLMASTEGRARIPLHADSNRSDGRKDHRNDDPENDPAGLQSPVHKNPFETGSMGQLFHRSRGFNLVLHLVGNRLYRVAKGGFVAPVILPGRLPGEAAQWAFGRR